MLRRSGDNYYNSNNYSDIYFQLNYILLSAKMLENNYLFRGHHERILAP